MIVHVCSASYHTREFTRVIRSAVVDVFTRVGDTCDVFDSAVGVFDIAVLYTCVCRRC